MQRFAADNDVSYKFLLDYNGFISQFYAAPSYGYILVVDAATRKIKYHGHFDLPKIKETLADLGVK